MGKNIKVKFGIVHYNTPLLTECLIKSINKFTPNSEIYIFDNSNRRPFIYRQDNITYFDNTEGQYINFTKFINQYPDRTGLMFSPKHSISVEKLMELINAPFILIDPDTLLKKDATDVYDEKYAFIGTDMFSPLNNSWRIIPFFCFLNPKKIWKAGVHYYDEHYIRDINKYDVHNRDYDTGSSLSYLKDKMKWKEIDYWTYVEHLGSASYNIKGEEEEKKWLNERLNLWSDNMIPLEIPENKKQYSNVYWNIRHVNKIC